MVLVVEYAVETERAEVRLDGRRIAWRSSEAHFSATSGDFALFASLPKAMREARALHVRGRVDRQTLRNAWLISHFWSQWRPELYSPVSISADEIVDAPRSEAGEGHVICLSSGVDSTYACLSAVTGSPPENRFDVTTGVFIQGFDYPLDDAVGYSRVLQSIRHLVQDFGIRAVPVETNWKIEICGRTGAGSKPADWEDVHMIGLACVLHLFSGSFRGGIIASDYSFREDHTVAPWSSNATTNRLLGSGAFPVHPTGEHVTRLQKIEAIHNWGKLPLVNVCWAGPRTGVNCSRCGKCLRTMLSCEALGIDTTPTFGRKLVARDIGIMHLTNDATIARVRQALDAPGGMLPRSLSRAAELAIVKSKVRNRINRAKLLFGALTRNGQRS